MDNIIIEISKEFISRLQEKNSWGKNEVEKLYLEVSNKIMSEFIEHRTEKLRFFAERYGSFGNSAKEILDSARRGEDNMDFPPPNT